MLSGADPGDTGDTDFPSLGSVLVLAAATPLGDTAEARKPPKMENAYHPYHLNQNGISRFGGSGKSFNTRAMSLRSSSLLPKDGP